MLKNTTPEKYKYEIVCLIILADNCPSIKDIKLSENFKNSRIKIKNLSKEDEEDEEDYKFNVDAIISDEGADKAKEFNLDKYLKANKFFVYTNLDLYEWNKSKKNKEYIWKSWP